MAIKIKEPVSLNELSRELGATKSKLTYYVSQGLIRPEATVGRMQIFDRVKTIKILKLIEIGKTRGQTLEEIKKTIKNL